MRTQWRRSAWTALLLGVLPYVAMRGSERPDGASVTPASVAPVDSLQVVRAFAQRFYRWYVPIANDSTLRYPAYYRVLSVRSAMISKDLATALRSDSTLSSSKAEHEGLTDDPFLQSQDPCERYDVDSVYRVQREFRARIRPMCATNAWQTSKPTLAIRSERGRLVIANVWYDPRGDLISELCGYARVERVPLAKSPACARR